MKIALIVTVAVCGVALTVFSAARVWRISRQGGPNELVLGYLAAMVAVSAVSLLLLRAL